MEQDIDKDKFATIRAVVSDVDGVLTRGEIHVGPGGEIKIFNVRDGLGIKLLQAAGIPFAICSARHSPPVEQRAQELGISCVKVGRADKDKALQEISESLGIPCNQMAFIGDDLPDLAAIRMVGVGFCPSDAAPEVMAAVHRVVPVRGGFGAVRAVAEWILKAQDLWQDAVARFEGHHG